MDATGQPIPQDVNCVIFVEGNRARVTGVYPMNIVKKATSYPVEGAFFSPAFKRKKWDGRKHFMNAKCEMPAGLVQTVVNTLYDYNPNAVVQVARDTDLYAFATAEGLQSLTLEGIEFGKGKYDYQLQATVTAVNKRRGILKLATNAGKTEIACAITKWLGLPTLFLVTSRDLLYQTQKRFSKRLGVPISEIGVIGDGEFSIGKWITVASVESLLNKQDQVSLSMWNVVFADECHQVGSTNFYDLLDLLPAIYRFGLSGTPLNRTDGADLRLVAQTGEIIYEVSNKILIERGVSVRPHIEMHTVAGPKLPKTGLEWNDVLSQGIVENPNHNNLVVERAAFYANQGLRVLVMVERRVHGQVLGALLTLKNRKVKHQYIHGDEDTDVRESALTKLEKKKINCLITTKILDQGIDTPGIDVIIFAAGGASPIRALQRIGRGMRTGPGKSKLIVVDFINLCHKWLADHSIERLKTYKFEDAFIIESL